MKRHSHTLAAVGALLIAVSAPDAAFAQKLGGILRIPHGDSPASMSTHEEATRSTATPMMEVFNNLVIFDQHVPQNTLSSIVPDLAVAWSWDEDKTALTFQMRQDVRWHDGKPFTPRDVKCTWDLLTGKSSEKLRVNPRKSWYRNLEEVTVDSDSQVTFHLKRPQPFFTALLASGASPVYPCHVSPAQMRQHPIGTGPFKFVEYKPNESIRLIRNADYWKPGRPYLDGIEYTIIPNLSTRMLAFTAGKVDMTFPYGVSIPLLKEVKSQAPKAICETTVATGSRTLILNQTAPPFDNAELRRAIVLALDRGPFIDILSEGQGEIGGVMARRQCSPARFGGPLAAFPHTVGRRQPDCRIYGVKLGIDIDLPRLADEDYRRVAVLGGIPCGDRDRQPLVGAIAKTFHDCTGFLPVLLHVGSVAR
jgi:peptide/nickel transport system substrate-binding protein